MKVSILVDNTDSWIIPYARDLCARLSQKHRVRLCFETSEVPRGDILFLLGCVSITPRTILMRNKYNFVVHESDLPKGRGFSPISWQVLKGENKIPITIFEATEKLDAGPVYLKDYIKLDGTELLPEIKQKQGKKTTELIMKLLRRWPRFKGMPQKSMPTYYRRRSRRDDMLNPRRSIIENFNHLRIVDNKKYPAWFKYKGENYILKIYKMDNAKR